MVSLVSPFVKCLDHFLPRYPPRSLPLHLHLCSFVASLERPLLVILCILVPIPFPTSQALPCNSVVLTSLFCFFLRFIYLFILFFWLCWVFVAARRLSLVATSRSYSSLWCVGFSLLWLLLLQSTGSRRAGFSSCGSWAQSLCLMGSRVQAQ